MSMMNDVEEADGPDPAAGDYLGEVVEQGSSHGLERLADDYAEVEDLGALDRPYCAEHDMYRPCQWCPDDQQPGMTVVHHGNGAATATLAGPNPLGDVTPYGQPVGQLAAEIVSARVYCTKHRIARCTVCTGTSNAKLVSEVSYRPEDAVVARTNDRQIQRRSEFDAAVKYAFSLRLASWLLVGLLEELVWDYDTKLARIGRGDLS